MVVYALKIIIEDEADVITGDEEDDLKDSLREFLDTTGIVPAVVTVNNEDWQDRYDDLTDYILKQAEEGTLPHSVLFAEPGAGKTYSVFEALRELLSSERTYRGRKLIPVFISSLLICRSSRSVSSVART